MWVLGFRNLGFGFGDYRLPHHDVGFSADSLRASRGLGFRVELEWPCGRGLWGLGLVFVFLRAPFRLLLRKPLNRFRV